MSVWAGLIERLEACQGPDRELDDAIWVLAVPRPPHNPAIATKLNIEYSPRYTSSLDAALTLVPEGWFPRIEPRFYDDPDRIVWWVNMIKPNWPRYQAVAHGLEDFEAIGTIRHDNRVIACVIAALKARVSHGVDEPG